MSSPPRKIPASLRTHHCWHRLLPSTTGTARLFAHTLLVASLLATLLLACFCLPSQLPCWTSTAVLLLPQTLCATIVFLSAAADLYALPMHSRVPSVLNLCSGWCPLEVPELLPWRWWRTGAHRSRVCSRADAYRWELQILTSWVLFGVAPATAFYHPGQLALSCWEVPQTLLLKQITGTQAKAHARCLADGATWHATLRRRCHAASTALCVIDFSLWLQARSRLSWSKCSVTWWPATRKPGPQ